MSEKQCALKEFQQHFPKQKKVNAIEAFFPLCLEKTGLKVRWGERVRIGEFPLTTPLRNHYADRYFIGSSFSAHVAEQYNLHYGFISLIANLTEKSKYKITKEFTRALIKRGIKLSASYARHHIDGKIICNESMLYPDQAEFYVKLFDFGKLKKEMRLSVLKNYRNDRIGIKTNNNEINIDSEVFNGLCDEYGYEHIANLLQLLHEMKDDDNKRQAIWSLTKFILKFSSKADKKFYKKLERLIR